MIPVEAIQRVMERLGNQMDLANEQMKSKDYGTRREGYFRKTELRNAIIWLEEVVAQYAPDHSGDAANDE
jgi:hypothetical protein